MDERPIIHREMSVEVAQALVAELKDLLMLETLRYEPEQVIALYEDLRQTLAQLRDQA